MNDEDLTARVTVLLDQVDQVIREHRQKCAAVTARMARREAAFNRWCVGVFIGTLLFYAFLLSVLLQFLAIH